MWQALIHLTSWDPPRLCVDRNALQSGVADRVMFYLGTHGPSVTIDTACSSSMVTHHELLRSRCPGSLLKWLCRRMARKGVTAHVVFCCQVALATGVASLRKGECDMAIVGACNGRPRRDYMLVMQVGTAASPATRRTHKTGPCSRGHGLAIAHHL